MLSSARRRTFAVVVACGAAAAAQFVATPAAVAQSPAKLCAALGNLDLPRGACASSVATSGATSADDVVPSGAAYVANCKGLESTDFVAGDDGARPYPYQFYKGVLDNPQIVAAMLEVPLEVATVVSAKYEANASAFVANNRAGCVQVLRGLHSGELFGMLFPAAP
jgi:hypothetical protein